MIFDRVIDIREIPNFKFKLTYKYKNKLWGVTNGDYDSMLLGNTAYFEESGENIVPYFDTGLYINLDSLNIIVMGRPNDFNRIAFPLELYLKECEIPCNRNILLIALERFFLYGMSIRDCFIEDGTSGSLIAMSLMRVVSNESLVASMYNHIWNITQALSRDEAEELLDKRMKNGSLGRIIGVFSVLRTIGKDYVLRSCIEVPNYLTRVLKNLYGYSPAVKSALEEKMGLDIFDIEKFSFNEWSEEREKMDGFIDLNRLSLKIKRIKEAVNG